VDKDNTTIINGAGKQKDISDRIRQIKKQIERSLAERGGAERSVRTPPPTATARSSRSASPSSPALARSFERQTAVINVGAATKRSLAEPKA